jgi:hypothetical protein
MDGWSALRSYIARNYKIAEDSVDSVKLVFRVGDSRTQAVRVTRIRDSGWAEISTAVCREDEICARDALVRSGRMVVGGLALHGPGIVIFRHAFQLANLQAEAFEEPLRLAVTYGDQLERELCGGRDLW